MKTVMCAVARTENKYIDEWCKYYFNLGFEHVYLFDNNDPDEPYVGDAISDEIKDKVTIFNVQGQGEHSAQTNWYLRFYKEYGDTFDWCAFFDIDEFLFLNGECDNDINKFLAQDKFNGVQQIMVKWKLFGDDGYIERDMSIPVYEFFKVVNDDKEPINRLLGKTMICGHLGELPTNMNCHYCRGLETAYPSGTRTPAKRYLMDYDGDPVFLNHYRTKTLREFLETKLVRQNRIYSSTPITLRDYYFRVNTWTQEKQDFADAWVKEHNIKDGKDL